MTDDRITALLGALHEKWNISVTAEPTRIMAKESGGGLLRLFTHHDYGGGGRSCYGWINPLTGDILYSGGWKSPGSKKPRGNVNAPDYGLSACAEHGVKTMEQLKAEAR